MKNANANNAAIKTLLSVNKNALRNLHDLFLYDFEKPFTAFVRTGRFTLKSIEKEAREKVADYNPETYTTVILTRGKYEYNSRYFKTARMDRPNHIEVDFRFHSIGEYYSNISNYYGKVEFESFRKDRDAETIVIFQHNENLISVSRPVWSNGLISGRRYKIHEYRRGNYMYYTPLEGDGVKVFASINGRRFEKNGKSLEKEEVFDKSGYFVYEKRDKLERAAKKVRAEKEKAAADARDYSGPLKTLENKLFEIKSSIAKRLDAAGTLEEVKEVSEMMNKWRGLPDVWQDYIFLRDRAANKGFSSPAVFDSRYADITAALEKINNKLNEKR